MMTNPRRILTLDWDWITGDCSRHRLNHPHCGWCNQFGRENRRSNKRGAVSQLGPTRFDTYGRAAVALLKRVLRHPVKAYVSECHADIVRLLQPGDDIWSFDAHSDGADCGQLCCGSWELTAWWLLCKVYNEAHDGTIISWSSANTATMRSVKVGGLGEAAQFRRRVDIIHLCRSSPFTPRECDVDFYALCHSIAQRAPLVFFGYRAEELKQEYMTLIGGM